MEICQNENISVTMYMLYLNGSLLDQVTAWCLFSAKPLSEPADLVAILDSE